MGVSGIVARAGETSTNWRAPSDMRPKESPAVALGAPLGTQKATRAVTVVEETGSL